jgi:O-antigen/teichoic acid export membrane protein
MTVVITMSYFFRSVDAVIWGLVLLESIRLMGSGIAWAVAGKKSGKAEPGDWSRMLHFCLPTGGSNLLGMSNRYAASVFVAKAMGPAALAHYTIGTYVEPIVITLRNSLSDALLPAMVNRGVSSRDAAVLLWQRGTVVMAIMLFPIGVLIERFAYTLIVTTFSSSYELAVPVMRVFLIVLIRECFDFPMALKAINRTRYFLYGDVAAIIVNLGLLALLVPRWGLVGATGAYVISSWLQGAYLGWCTTIFYQIPVRALIPWRDLCRVAMAAAIPLALTYGDFLTDRFKLFGVIVASALYLPAYALLLWLFRVKEAHLIFERVRERLAARFPVKT